MGVFKKKDGKNRFGFGGKKKRSNYNNSLVVDLQEVAHQELIDEVDTSTPEPKAGPSTRTPPTQSIPTPEEVISEVLEISSDGSASDLGLNMHQRSSTPVKQMLEEFQNPPRDEFEVFTDGVIMKRDPSRQSNNSNPPTAPIIITSRAEDEWIESTPHKVTAMPVVPSTTKTKNGQKRLIDNFAEAGKASNSSAPAEPQSVTRKLLSAFNSADPCSAITEFPSALQQCVPDQVRCDVVPNNVEVSPAAVARSESYYNDQFALDFLEELLNVGYALVSHQSLGEDWVGRSVTMVLKPGEANAVATKLPCLEWATLGGGKQKSIETTTICLLDVHSITSSMVEDLDDDNDDDGDDWKCFFTITTKQGDVHVMEAITPDESNRLVTGIRNLAARLSRQLISGDSHVISEFFNANSSATENRLRPEQAVLRLCHKFLEF